ncbi:patatin family protein [Metabacillus herbersteinensis]|uniref:Patatin family protein n=1 Tax=Metabacillus herbersteinensis TaxID=283816 RepID=A0ABV6GB19_9BACI
MNQAGLVLEGGGMRGLYTAGVLEYFMEKELYFPYVIGVSAGACFGASYVSRQKGRNRKVNIDYVTHPNYLSFRNVIKHRQLFGMDFLFDEIPNKIVPFDFQAFNEAPEKFLVATTDCETGEPIYYDKKTYGKDILTIIRASSSLPFIAPFVQYDGKTLLDGGIVDSIPLKKSEADGNKRNVVILTKNLEYRKKKPSMQWLVQRSFQKYPNLVKAILTRYEMYNSIQAYLEEREKNGDIFVIRPSMPLEVARIERNPIKLERLYQLGIEDARNTFLDLQDWLAKEENPKITS